MSALTMITNTVRNYKPDPSVVAGGSASLLVYLAGSALVAAGVALPVVGPITMAMVGIASPIIGHLVTYLVPDSMKTSMDNVAKKLGTTIDQIKVITPEIEYTYPPDKLTGQVTGNLTKE